MIYPFRTGIAFKPRGNEFIGIKPGEINLLATSRYRYSQQHLMALIPVTFPDDDEFELHRHLRAIDNNTLLSRINGEDCASPSEKFIPPDFIPVLYEDYPEVIRNTMRIADECHIDIDFSTLKNKSTFTGSRYDDKLLLE